MSIDTGGRKSVSPGDTVTIKGKATPGSFMAFRAVDKSVLLMKEDTDLTYAKVIGLLCIFIEGFVLYSRNCKYDLKLPHSDVRSRLTKKAAKRL